MSVIYGRTVTMKLLGDTSRSFKPGFPVSVYVSSADINLSSSSRRCKQRKIGARKKEAVSTNSNEIEAQILMR